MTRAFILSVFLVCLLGFASCKLRKPQFNYYSSHPSNDYAVSGQSQGWTNLVTIDNTVRNVNLVIGDHLDLVLEENPSTGFRWFEALSQPNVLVSFQDQGMSNYHVKNSHSSGLMMVGAPGLSHFLYRAIARGSVVIRLTNKRFHELESARTHEVQVTVA